MLQRKCRFVNHQISQIQSDPYVVANEEEEVTVGSLKIKLPKSYEQWIEANNYFRSIVTNIKLQSGLLDRPIRFKTFLVSIYDFFKTSYGTIKSTNQTNDNLPPRLPPTLHFDRGTVSSRLAALR